MVNSSQPAPAYYAPRFFRCIKGMSLRLGANVVLCTSIDKVDHENIHFKEVSAISRAEVLVSSF